MTQKQTKSNSKFSLLTSNQIQNMINTEISVRSKKYKTRKVAVIQPIGLIFPRNYRQWRNMKKISTLCKSAASEGYTTSTKNSVQRAIKLLQATFNIKD